MRTQPWRSTPGNSPLVLFTSVSGEEHDRPPLCLPLCPPNCVALGFVWGDHCGLPASCGPDLSSSVEAPGSMLKAGYWSVSLIVETRNIPTKMPHMLLIVKQPLDRKRLGRWLSTKFLLCKRGNLSLNPQHPQKKLGAVARTCHPSVEGGGRREHRACWPASLTKPVSSKFRERPCPQK